MRAITEEEIEFALRGGPQRLEFSPGEEARLPRGHVTFIGSIVDAVKRIAAGLGPRDYGNVLDVATYNSVLAIAIGRSDRRSTPTRDRPRRGLLQSSCSRSFRPDPCREPLAGELPPGMQRRAARAGCAIIGFVRRDGETGLPMRVTKPWGFELWYARTDSYAGKILHVARGHRLSLQYHEHKDESCYLLSGCVLLVQGSNAEELQEWELGPGSVWRNMPGLVHTIEALEDSDVLEVSTPELDDVVRISDQYGREGTTAP